MAGASVRITADLRRRLVTRILRLGPGWVAEERSGELEAVLVDGVEKLDAYFRLFLSKVIVAGITAAAIVIVVIVVDPVVGLVLGGFALALVLLPRWSTERWARTCGSGPRAIARSPPSSSTTSRAWPR